MVSVQMACPCPVTAVTEALWIRQGNLSEIPHLWYTLQPAATGAAAAAVNGADLTPNMFRLYSDVSAGKFGAIH